MQNVNQGGVELVFFLVTGSPPEAVGVRVGEAEYHGFPASAISKELSQFSNLYFSLFAIPALWNGETPYIFARNAVGAETRINFPYRVIRRKFPKAPITLSEAFLDSATLKLSKADGTKAQQFKWVNETYRQELAQKLSTIFSSSIPERKFGSQFQRPAAGSNRSGFFEQRQYFFNKELISESVHEGIDLAGTAMMPVSAAADGKVVFADDLGIYGNTVIIDHGIGVFTLYGHLSSMAVAQGDNVKVGSIIGRSGDTGLAGGDHLHYEVRLNNTSVNPIEWWDERWMRDHIEAKIEFVKEQMLNRAALQAAVEAQ
jgi:murein DD-endopeptidase MepM/ murein hydrolase activator NlpD